MARSGDRTLTTADDNPAEADAAVLSQNRDAHGVYTLTLDRPAQYNALSDALLDALSTALTRIAADPGVRCVVLAARGKAFCAGHDLKELRATEDRDRHRATFERCSTVMQQIVALPVPVIARVQGLATAAGCQLVASCDLAIASTTARFAVSGINAGLFCSTPAVALSRNIATKRAFEMLVTGDFIDATTALDWGLLNRVVAADALDAEIADLSARICSKSGYAIRRGKALFHAQLEQPLSVAYQQASAVISEDLSSVDAREGIDAFSGKRPPRWQDR
ncbi:enoyl-CoA hydratase [Salinisphaera aquimarina]|uniref:Enoyl-CoA hydratase domain-containing protein 3, mitochondrial n=1 Tax=Salinisphaera aquimarina TaxID=2094031 RepID=A0ABV7EVD9_9GAMM